MMRSRAPREWIDGHVRRLIGRYSEHQRAQLAEAPIASVRGLGLVVQESWESFDNECGIDGLYLAEDPPRICITVAKSPGRTNFTVLHELGHHLQYDDDQLNDELLDMEDNEEIEEDLADAIAAKLLIPDVLVDEIIGDRGPTAGEVAALFRATKASRKACCVAACQRLSGPGYVVQADPDGTVRFAANAGTLYKIARNTQQDPQHLLARAGRSGFAGGEARLKYATGNETDLMHAQAVEENGYVFGVFTAGRASWVKLHILPEDGPRVAQVVCDHCDRTFWPSGDPCDGCGQHICFRCNRCGCHGSSIRQKTCGSCWLTKPVSQFPDGADTCVECA